MNFTPFFRSFPEARPVPPVFAGMFVRFGFVGDVAIEARVPGQGSAPRDARNAVYVADQGGTLIVEPTAPAWLVRKLWAARVAAAKELLAHG